MTNQKSNDPLHSKTLEMILLHLVDYFGWEELSYRIKIKCFSDNPSIKSSLNFLRKTAWARKKVESLYLYSLRKDQWAAEKRMEQNKDATEVAKVEDNFQDKFESSKNISSKVVAKTSNFDGIDSEVMESESGDFDDLDSEDFDSDSIDSESLDLDNQYEADILKQLKKSFG
jgi:uncharacterized protein (DUF2132 family)